MDESNFVAVEAPEVFSVGAQSIVQQAKQLGLTWTFQPGTVTTTLKNIGTVTFDGDTAAVNCFNLSDAQLSPGTRVMGIITPTGNYIISTLGTYTSGWRAFAPLNGWTVVGGTLAQFRNTLYGVQVVAILTPGTTADGTVIGNLPPDSRPTAFTVSGPLSRNPSPAAPVIGPLLQLSIAGDLIITGCVGASTIWVNILFPIDVIN